MAKSASGIFRDPNYRRAGLATPSKGDGSSQKQKYRQTDQDGSKTKQREATEDRFTPLSPTEAIRGTVIFDFLLDGSGSMKRQYPFLQEMMRDVAIPGIKGIETKVRKGIRIACSLFSDNISPVWLGYRTTRQIGLDPLPSTAFNAPGIGGCTALYSSILARITEMEQAITFYSKKAAVTCKFLVLTDGAEYSNSGVTMKDVHARLSKYKDGASIYSMLVYFETGENLSEAAVRKMKEDMGFKEYKFYGSDKPLAERQRRFRNDLDLFSSRSTS